MDSQAIEASKSFSPLFEIVTDSLNDGLIIFNEIGQINYINKACRGFFDVSENEPAGKFLNDIFPEKFHIKTDKNFVKGLKKVIGKGTELMVFDDMGTSAMLYVRMEDVFNGLFMLVFRDITSIKDQDKLLADEVIKRSNLEESNFILKERVKKAARLSKGSLPEDAAFSVFREHFIFFKPLIELGGDHYYFKKFENSAIIAIYDCNDIGVAGAYQAMMIKAHLDSIIINSQIEPSQVLEEINSRILQDEVTHGLKGVRIHLTICQINLETKAVKYAGAKGPVLVIGNGFYKEVIGNQKALPIREEQKIFQREFTLKEEETLFLHTDGVQNQLNEKGEQLDRARLIEMLLNINTDSLAKQCEILEYEINDWQGKGEQTDDITIIGIRF